jgi:DNA polymerase III sliding clamp (beta) subunit (PCNA family)
MNRVDLIEKLKLVEPALSINNLVPVLSHFWFFDNTLMAYNDQIAIKTKLNSEFVGAVPGDTLLALLNASRAKDVEFFVKKDANGKELPEGTLSIKAASSNLKLPYMDLADTPVFQMPESQDSTNLPVDITAFLSCLESCMKSLKEDTSIPDSLGITLSFEDSLLKMYATNDATISYASLKLKQKTKNRRTVISGNFCRQMLALSSLSGKKHLEITSDYSLYICGDTILFGRLVDVPRPLDFDSVIESAFPKEVQKNLVEIPTKLSLILDRAIIITDTKDDNSRMSVSVKDGIAKFFTASERAQAEILKVYRLKRK